MTFEAYCRAVVTQWQEGKRTADDAIRAIREALSEEDAIRLAESREAGNSNR